MFSSIYTSFTVSVSMFTLRIPNLAETKFYHKVFISCSLGALRAVAMATRLDNYHFGYLKKIHSLVFSHNFPAKLIGK